MTQRSTTEIRVRCLSIINNKKVVSLVKESSSPTAAYDIVLTITQNLKKAKAGRWLAILRRDFPNEYTELIS